jgi:UDP-glucose 4-epimerase
MNILVTGGLGYIGSHVCVKLLELLDSNYVVIIVDNLSNSKQTVLYDIIKITNKKYDENLFFYNFDITDELELNNLFLRHSIFCVIHMAGFKSVSESIKYPLQYYHNNVVGTIILLNMMNKYNCKKLIFSSSATVYGNQDYPVNEDCITGVNITNPYGQTKHMIENILIDLYKSDNEWNIVVLRYFNPVGAHSSGLLGEDPNNIPNNLFPYILKVANGEYSKLTIYGNDYNTSDGTCERDFIHVCDLANGHTLALIKIINCINGLNIYNLGTGKPISVMKLVETFKEVNNVSFECIITDRRYGDLPIVYADVNKAYTELGWCIQKSIIDICKDGWNSYKK